MNPLLVAAALAFAALVGVGVALHFRGYRLGDYRPVRKPPTPKRKRPRHYPNSPRPGSRYADLQVRAPLYGHPTAGLTREQIVAALAEGRDQDGAP